MTPFSLRAHTHLLVLAGSRAQGIHTPSSDVDLRGAAVPPAPVLLGFRQRWEQADQPGTMAGFVDLLTPEEAAAGAGHGLEGTVYELRKVFALAADCNPNLLELLACRDQEVRLCSPLGERLRAILPLFLSQKARHTFGGYARSQLARIQTHRRWLLDPPRAAPARAAFGLPERSLLPKDQLAAAEAAVRKRMDEWVLDFGDLPQSEVIRIQDRVAATLAEIGLAVGAPGLAAGDTWLPAARAVGLDDNLIEVMDRERRYRAAQRAWEQYQGWRVGRNPARSALEARHGYDTKHGAHLVRLLRMGREILEQGRVRVWRGDLDGEELRAIRAGAWPYEALLAWAQEADAELDALLREGRAVVPARPDLGALDAACAELVARGMAAG
ncbi:nucleotidyltransferase domain-containing protein [Myxococcota bacterium]|nr:nucleotidyltransferase domain-containing protein [Myxococcota bacterium]